jgi:Ca2+-binding RTX toxin-like protein
MSWRPVRLTNGWLVTGPDTRAWDANDYIIYNKTTGALSYDADGSGAAVPVQFAQLSAGLSLVSGDFLII